MPPKKIVSNDSQPPAERPRNPQPGSVMVQKRSAPETPSLREKLCATCGKPFQLTPDQKYYLCPACYRKAQPAPRKSGRNTDAQVLIQIQCAGCGTIEYLDFVPSDPANTYCRACFAERKREGKV